MAAIDTARGKFIRHQLEQPLHHKTIFPWSLYLNLEYDTVFLILSSPKTDNGVVQQRNLELSPGNFFSFSGRYRNMDVFRWTLTEEAMGSFAMHHTERLLKSTIGTQSTIP